MLWVNAIMSITSLKLKHIMWPTASLFVRFVAMLQKLIANMPKNTKQYSSTISNLLWIIYIFIYSSIFPELISSSFLDFIKVHHFTHFSHNFCEFSDKANRSDLASLCCRSILTCTSSGSGITMYSTLFTSLAAYEVAICICAGV